MKMEQTECSETSAYKIQTPGIYPEQNIQHTEHGERLKSRIPTACPDCTICHVLYPSQLYTSILPFKCVYMFCVTL